MLPLPDLEDRVKALALKVHSDKGAMDLISRQIGELETEVATLTKTVDTAQKARLLLESLTDKKREIVRTKIEALVTHGIHAVFGPSYSFKIEQKTARNNVTFEYKIMHDFGGQTFESDLRGYHGGGLVALVGFLLRVVMVLFTQPPRRRIIFLDETMAALDGDKRAPFARLMMTLGTQLEMQFVLVTHSPEYVTDADKAYEVVPVGDGSSTLRPI